MSFLTRCFYSPDGTGGGGDGGGAPDGGTAPAATGESWHNQHQFFKDNPEAVKAFSKYKTADEAFKGAHEAFKRFGKPFHLPEDGSKLTDEQRAELRAAYGKLNNVPDSPEGYEFDADDELPDHEPTMAKFKALLHERGIDPQTAKDLLGLQRGMVRELNAHRDRVFEGMGNNAYKMFKDTDCDGNEELAGTKMESIKRYLQTFATNKDGQPDPEAWEGFCKRHFIRLKDGSSRPTELILLRALAGPAQQAVGTGGAFPGGAQNPMGRSGLYSEMRKT